MAHDHERRFSQYTKAMYCAFCKVTTTDFLRVMVNHSLLMANLISTLFFCDRNASRRTINPFRISRVIVSRAGSSSIYFIAWNWMFSGRAGKNRRRERVKLFIFMFCLHIEWRWNLFIVSCLFSFHSMRKCLKFTRGKVNHTTIWLLRAKILRFASFLLIKRVPFTQWKAPYRSENAVSDAIWHF